MVDETVPKYKLRTNEDVISKAEHVRANLSEDDWNEISVAYESFIETFKSVNKSVLFSKLGRSSYFHLSIFKTVTRSLADNSDCGCLPVPFYFTDKTPFICQKDYIYDVASMKEQFNALSEDELSGYGDDGILALNYFNNSTESEVNYADFSATWVTPEEFEIALAIDCMQGSDLGCCGNYEGCCWYAHILCLAHDLYCLASDCGTGCGPDCES